MTASLENSIPQPSAQILDDHPMRNAVRFPLHLNALVYTDDGPVHAVTEDISATGVLFNMPFAPAIDSILRWTLQIPSADMGSSGDVAVECVGRVVWHRAAQGGAQVGAVIDGYHMEDAHG